MRWWFYWVAMRLFICPLGWCGGHIESDEHGVYFICARCGRVTR